MNDESNIRNRIRAYIADTFLTDVEAGALQNDSDLLKILDSLQLLRLVMNIEAAFALKVADHELTAENLGSVERIALFVARKHVESRTPFEGLPANSVNRVSAGTNVAPSVAPGSKEGCRR
jgi:acyl carrier protein